MEGMGKPPRPQPPPAPKTVQFVDFKISRENSDFHALIIARDTKGRLWYRTPSSRSEWYMYPSPKEPGQ